MSSDEMSNDDMKELEAYRLEANNKANEKTLEVVDTFAQIKEETLKSDAIKLNKQTIRNEVAFDMGFEKVLEKNQGMFSVSADDIRKGVVGLEGSELVHSLKVVAAKDFFSNADNLNLLIDADKAFIENAVLGVHEKSIDSIKCWNVLEGALNVANRLSLAQGFRSKSVSGGSDTPNLDAYVVKSKNRMQGIKAQ